MLSRQVIAYYGLIRDSESLPATYEFAAEAAAPKEIGFGWESRGSPFTPLDCARVPPPLPRWPRRVQMTVASSSVLAFTFWAQVRRSHWSFRGCRVHSELKPWLILRPANWLALLSRTFTFELALAGSPRTNVEYDYVGKQSIPTTGLSPASPTALWAADPDPDSFRPQNQRSRTQNPKQTRPQPPVERGWADKADSRPPLRGPGGWGGDWYIWHAPDGLRARAATGLGCMQAGAEKLGGGKRDRYDIDKMGSFGLRFG